MKPFSLTHHCSTRAHCRACRDAGPAGDAFRADKEEAFGGMGECPLRLPIGHPGPWPDANQGEPERTKANNRIPGPGTALAAVLRWCGIKPWEGCACESRKRQMDGWGWWGCVRNVGTIWKWIMTPKS